MGKAYIKGGTPIGSDSLCKTCSYSHIMTGYRESEMVTMCNEVKLAIDVAPAPMKPVGFKVGIGFREAAIVIRDDEDDE